MRRAITIILAAVAISAAGCGGGGNGSDTNDDTGLDRSDPEAVVRALVESFQRCGEEGAGLRAQLVYPEAAQEEQRTEQREEEAPGGCDPKPVSDVVTATVPSREEGIPLVVEVSGEDCTRTEVPMIEVDGAWYVDTSEISIGLICSIYGS